MIQTPATYLSSLVDSLKSDAKPIVDRWSTLESVTEIFDLYGIGKRRFAASYGLDIFNYLIGVIEGSQKIGDCPVMSKLVNFLLDKHITPKDVFIICMGLRRALIAYMFERHQPRIKEFDLLLEELSVILDQNLAGVLEIFTVRYEKQHDRLIHLSTQEKKLRQISRIINFIETKIVIFQNGNILLCNQPLLRLLGVSNIKELYARFENGFGFLHPKNLQGGENINDWIESITSTKESFDAEIYDTLSRKTALFYGEVQDISETNEPLYLMTLSEVGGAACDMSKLYTQFSQDQLTLLNNYATFIQLATKEREAAQKSGKSLYLMVVDIPQLKSINEQEGYAKGDQILMHTANILRESTDESMIVARLEGSRFGILLSKESTQELYSWSMIVKNRLNKDSYRRSVAFTYFDAAEGLNKSELRAYSLIDRVNSSDENRVITDIEGVEYIDGSQDKILENLRDCQEIDAALLFQELVVKSHAKIVGFKGETMAVRLSAKQLLFAKEGDTLYAQTKELGLIQAKILELLHDRSEALIGEFKSDINSPLKRKRVRVAASEELRVSLLYDTLEIDTKLLNLNDKFIALYAKRRRTLQESELVYLDMMLSSKNKREALSMNAIVYKLEAMDEGYKIVLLCQHNHHSQNLIDQYIASRQIEIIKELSELA